MSGSRDRITAAHATWERPRKRQTVALFCRFILKPQRSSCKARRCRTVSHSRRITQTLQPNLGDGKPQEIQLPPGTVTAMIKRVSDEYAPAATSGFTVQIAQRLAARP